MPKLFMNLDDVPFDDIEENGSIRAGEGELRFGDQRYPIRKYDVIACPTAGPEVAHQIINTGSTDLRYLALSTLSEVDACEYPDSGKVMIGTARATMPGSARCFGRRIRWTTTTASRSDVQLSGRRQSQTATTAIISGAPS